MKNLPIKLFEKRKLIDDRNPEGGGSNELPNWANISNDELKSRTESFSETLKSTEEWLKGRSKSREFIPAVLKLSIHDKAIAKTHRPDITKIFNVNGDQNVIAMVNSRDLLVKVNSADDIQRIQQKIATPEKYLKGIAAITELTQYVPDVILESKIENVPMRASLINYQNYNLNNAVCKAFELQCKQSEISYKKVNYSPELIIYRLSGVTQNSITEIVSFEGLETLAPMPLISITFDDLTSGVTDAVPIKYPETGKEYPTVGVLDSGISRIPHLAPWILAESFSKVPDDRRDESHGTFVAGRLIYGDDFDGIHLVGDTGCFIFDAAVIPDGKKDQIEESDLIEHVREAISKNNRIKFWNLSLGTIVEADKDSFSFFGMALDQIQIENDVIICKSAGNCVNFKHGYPVSRISKSADSVLSLVVGSIAHAKGVFDLADVNYPSPFSRIGSGPAFINKPEVTHVGGNAGINPKTGDIVFTGVRSFSKNGTLTTNIGTSFSTPRVTSLLAGINHSITETFSPLMLKAMAIHSAKYPLALSLPPEQRLKSMGYGIPENIDNILFNDPHEITLILQDTLEKGQWVQMLDFPFPSQMVENGLQYGELVLTLVTLPMFAEKQGGEYCQSNIEVRFGTHDGVRQTQRSANPISHQGGQNLLRGSLYGTGYRKGTSGTFARERTLIQYGDKFHPIKKYAFNLSEMTPANATNYLTAPKHWYLEIEGLFRDYICGRGVEDGIALSQDYCLIITIRDNKRKFDIYNTTTALLNSRGFVHSNINIKNDVRVRVGAQ